jgi:hypothetical protein
MAESFATRSVIQAHQRLDSVATKFKSLNPIRSHHIPFQAWNSILKHYQNPINPIKFHQKPIQVHENPITLKPTPTPHDSARKALGGWTPRLLEDAFPKAAVQNGALLTAGRMISPAGPWFLAIVEQTGGDFTLCISGFWSYGLYLFFVFAPGSESRSKGSHCFVFFIAPLDG